MRIRGTFIMSNNVVVVLMVITYDIIKVNTNVNWEFWIEKCKKFNEALKLCVIKKSEYSIESYIQHNWTFKLNAEII